MTKNIFMKIIIGIEVLVILRLLLIYFTLLILAIGTHIPKETLLLESTNVNGSEKIIISEIGKPFLQGDADIQVELIKDNNIHTSFQTMLSNGSSNIKSEQFDVLWKSDYVQIVFMPYEDDDFIIEISLQ